MFRPDLITEEGTSFLVKIILAGRKQIEGSIRILHVVVLIMCSSLSFTLCTLLIILLSDFLIMVSFLYAMSTLYMVLQW